jgi:protein gp37
MPFLRSGFLSVEPMLQAVDLGPWLDELEWVIAGSESGHGARPCNLDWVRNMRDQCVAAGVAFFWKQHVERAKKTETPELDGKQWVEYPR